MAAPNPEWTETALDDLFSIVGYISDDNPRAAQLLKDEIETRASRLPKHPKLYKAGRVAGTREMVVRANYIVIYAAFGGTVKILRVLHAARQWPPGSSRVP
jgi:addiction module RelE/StbE family toxin